MRSQLVLWLLVGALCVPFSPVAADPGAAPRRRAGGALRGTPTLVLQSGHKANVRGMVFSPDGELLASAADDWSVKIWDLVSGLQLRTLAGVSAPRFNADGTLIAGQWGKMGKVWDIATGREVLAVEGGFPVFLADGKSIATAGNMVLKIWDLASGKLLRTLGPVMSTAAIDAFYSLWVSPDGKQIGASLGGYEGPTKRWELESGAPLPDLPVRTQDYAVSPDAKTLAVSDASAGAPWTKGGVMLFDFATAKQRGATLATGFVTSLAYSPDGKQLVTGTMVSESTLWEVESGRKIRTWPNQRVVAWSPDGRIIATSAESVSDGQSAIRLLDAESGNLIKTLTGNTPRVGALSLSADGRWLATGGDDGAARVWDLARGRVVARVRGHLGQRALREVTAVSLSSDGARLMTAGEDGWIKVWSIPDGAQLAAYQARPPDQYGRGHIGAAMLPNGQRVYAFSPEPGTSGTQNGIELQYRHGDGFTQPVVSPSGLVLGYPQGDGAAMWKTDVMAFPKRLPAADLLAFNADGSSVATVRGGLLQIFETTGWSKVGALEKAAATAIAFVGAGTIAVANYGTIELRDIATGAVTATLPGHAFGVSALAATRDGRTLISASAAGEVKLWNLATRAEVATLISVGEAEGVVALPDGHYLASKGATRGVAFRVGNRAFPFEQFDLRLNRPDLVLKSLGYLNADAIEGYAKAYRKRLKRMAFTEAMLSDDARMPVLDIVAVPALITTEPVARIGVHAADPDAPLDRVNVYVNDVPIHGAAGIPLRARAVKAWDGTLEIPLSRGANKIQLSVLGGRGVESLRETVLVNYKAAERKDDLYAVVIGVSEYADKANNLSYAAKDAADLGQALEGWKDRFGAVHVTRILDKAATRERILAVRTELVKSKVDDEVIVFVAGHGLLDDQLNYYLGTTDVAFDKPAGRGLRYDELEGLLDGIPARKKLLLMDTCFSGEVDKDEAVLADNTQALPDGKVKTRAVGTRGLKKKPGGAIGLRNVSELLGEAFADLRRGSGAMVISSAGGAEFALESSEWNNGVFTYALLQGLQKGAADRNRDGSVQVSELRDFVVQKVAALTGGRQTPTARHENLESDFIVH